MIILTIDASINSTGYCIVDTEAKTIELNTITPEDYVKQVVGTAYDRWTANSEAIALAIYHRLLRYRFSELTTIAIETINVGIYRKASASLPQLIFEIGSLSSHFKRLTGIQTSWVTSQSHKKALTGNAKADKNLSVHHMLMHFPFFHGLNTKLDDLADALALAVVKCPDCLQYKLI